MVNDVKERACGVQLCGLLLLTSSDTHGRSSRGVAVDQVISTDLTPFVVISKLQTALIKLCHIGTQELEQNFEEWLTSSKTLGLLPRKVDPESLPRGLEGKYKVSVITGGSMELAVT